MYMEKLENCIVLSTSIQYFIHRLVQFNVREPAAKCGAAVLPAKELQTSHQTLKLCAWRHDKGVYSLKTSRVLYSLSNEATKHLSFR